MEYDFSPNPLKTQEGDCVHVNFMGSDYNPNRQGNNGEGMQVGCDIIVILLSFLRYECVCLCLCMCAGDLYVVCLRTGVVRVYACMYLSYI